jgi:hypothetical protein
MLPVEFIFIWLHNSGGSLWDKFYAPGQDGRRSSRASVCGDRDRGFFSRKNKDEEVSSDERLGMPSLV